MVGRAAERERQAKPGKARVQNIEENGIFNGKQPGQPEILDIVDRKPRLKAGKFARRPQEPFRRLPQLARGGRVFGIEDDQEFATRQRKRDVQRARLCSRPARRRDDDLIGGRQMQGFDGPPRRVIVLFDHELDVELASRIVDPVKRGDELADDAGFPVQGDDNRIDRQPAVGDGRRPEWLPAAHGARRSSEETEPDRGEEETCHRQGDRDERHRRGQAKGKAGRADGRNGGGALRPARARLGG